VCSDTKSQNVSWADCACGISRSGWGLGRVDDVGELDAVLNEEHRHVVSHQIERVLVGVELHREPAGVTDRVGGSSRAEHTRETLEDFGFRALFAEESGLGHRRRVAVGLEHPVRGGTTGVHHALRDVLVVEVGDLLPQVKVFQQCRAASTRLQRVIGVRQAQTLGRRQKVTGLGTWIRVGTLAVRDASRTGASGSTLIGFARCGHVKSPRESTGVQSVRARWDPVVLHCLAERIPQSRKRKQINRAHEMLSWAQPTSRPCHRTPPGSLKCARRRDL
jgi:hypothetical protein